MPSKTSPRELQCGDTLTLISSGGGGWGDPLERDPKLVFQDYNNGVISMESALNDYGVSITSQGLDISQTIKNRRMER